VFTGKHPARSPETDGDLIGDKMDIVAGAEVAELPEITGRVDLHPRSALDEGFDNDPADFLMMVRIIFSRSENIRHRNDPGIYRKDNGNSQAPPPEGVKHQRLVDAAVQIDIPHGQGPRVSP